MAFDQPSRPNASPTDKDITEEVMSSLCSHTSTAETTVTAREDHEQLSAQGPGPTGTIIQIRNDTVIVSLWFIVGIVQEFVLTSGGRLRSILLLFLLDVHPVDVPLQLLESTVDEFRAMASSLVARAVRRAATVACLSSPPSLAQATSLVQRRGLAGARPTATRHADLDTSNYSSSTPHL
ncbi:hypothetical protein RHSIM_Rhsim09G0151800 [Rhododendron simsii]|uniref:Uncharacterized protein n=1 Tax=Rhododendron simsii TaxID=118357 RepID=A0A834GJ21_RHOSS|nr:hypothetical protein RHSIM_Rhsim09G0151800 [Rhododendron simsii]